MEPVILISLFLLLVIVFFILVKAQAVFSEKNYGGLEQHLSQITSQLNQQINNLTVQVNQRLQDNVLVLQKTQENISQRLDTTSQLMSRVDTNLGKLYETNQHIFTVGKDLSKLSDLLQAPSFRGGFGELLLENLLEQILPRQNYELKFKFKNGQQVDAVIKVGDKIVPIDSKFPYENFRRLTETKVENEKQKYRREFYRDVKVHIDKISSSYILPEEGTFDFALMYIPAENVYYETVIKNEEKNDEKDIFLFALAKRVIPVSPNSFYAYLQSILLGLRGLEIEKNAQEILSYLHHLRVDFSKFREEFRILGTHVTNARNKFEETDSLLNKFSNRLESASQNTQSLKDPSQNS